MSRMHLSIVKIIGMLWEAEVFLTIHDDIIICT